MEALPVVLVASLALYMVPIAFGLKCYVCSNKPEIYGGTKCESEKAENITCDPLVYNRCMTANYTMAIGPLGSTSIEIRNCSSSFSCDPDSQWNICKLVNVTGILTDCSLDCCQGDLCNNVSGTTPKPEPAGLECYACSNKPEIFGGTKCESDKADKITCDPLIYNRCMTTKYNMSIGPFGPTSVELRNCTNSFACDPHSQWNTCKMSNLTGMLTDCSLDCCHGDLCNKFADTTAKPAPAIAFPQSVNPSHRAKPFVWICVKPTGSSVRQINSFSYERYCTKIRFETVAQGLECYSCSNKPEIFGGTKCESGKADKITCDPLFYNRCMTTKYTTSLGGLLGPMSIERRNCSSDFACDPDDQFNCKCKNSCY